MITAEVQTAINHARGQMGTNPEAAIQELKTQLENVKRSPDLRPEVRDQLVDQLEGAIRTGSQRQIEDNQRHKEHLERLAEVGRSSSCSWRTSWASSRSCTNSWSGSTR
jgi:hypothetical protein